MESIEIHNEPDDYEDKVVETDPSGRYVRVSSPNHSL